MDERVLKILKTVAVENRYETDMGYLECVFCSGDEQKDEFDDIAHEATCETIQARAVLKELGMPLIGYRVTFESLPYPERSWQPRTHWQQGFSVNEVCAWYHSDVNCRNVQFEQVREL